MNHLKRSFYNRPAPIVAREILGAHLVRLIDGRRLVGIIREAEAYQGEEDLGCHAHNGKTRRNAVMYGPPGHAYIYFTYGMHWMLNAVTGAEGSPAAVLIRAVQPLEGLELFEQNRPNLARTAHWLDGPAKLTQAMLVDRRLNGIDLSDPAGELSIVPGEVIPAENVTTTARIGLNTVPEPWKSIPWRFVINKQAFQPDDEIQK
ncbi:MAG: DNA-3-methyladenine glycosylase [Anaerolineaceae bacterium]